MKTGVTLVGAATAVWLVAVARILWVNEINLPPVRWMDVDAADGPLAASSAPWCASPRLVVGEAVWGWCEWLAHGGAAGFVRFDLKTKRADVLWPHGDQGRVFRGYPVAFALGPGDDVLVASDLVGTSTILRLQAGGGGVSLGAPQEGVLALALAGDAVEVVTNSHARIGIHRRPLAAGEWTSQPISKPPCPPDLDCRVQAAERVSDGWHVWATGTPIGWDGSQRSVRVLEWSQGEWRDVGSIALERPPEPKRVGDALVTPVFDRSRGGGVAGLWALEWEQLFERRDGVWEQLRAPVLAGEQPWGCRADLIATAAGLRATTRIGVGCHVQRLGGRWLTATHDGDRIRFGPLAGESGPDIVGDVGLRRDAVLVPADDGGLWVLGADGAYVHLNEAFARTDTPGFFARFGLLYGNFRRLAEHDDFWRDLRWLKVMVLPAMLLVLPLGVLVLMALRRRRYLPGLACAYLGIGALGGWWYWHLTAWF